MRREWNARPAMTKLSDMGDLIRILDLQRPADKSQVDPASGAGLVTRWIPARPNLLLYLVKRGSDQWACGRRSQLKSTPMPNEELLSCNGTLRLKSNSRSK